MKIMIEWGDDGNLVISSDTPSIAEAVLMVNLAQKELLEAVEIEGNEPVSPPTKKADDDT